MSDQIFEQRWLHGINFTVAQPGTVRAICPEAKPFAEMCQCLLAETNSGTTDIKVNLAFITLQEKFFAWFEDAPAACKKHLSIRKGKVICFFALYRETYMALRELERTKINPPRLRKPPPAPPPPPAPVTKIYQIGSFPIGEREDDEE